MNLAASLRALASAALDPDNRPARLNFGPQHRDLEQLILLQQLSISEGFMTGLHGVLTCVTSQADLSEKQLLGVPVGVQIVTDRGQFRPVNGIVTKFRRGQSDGGLTVCQLTVADGLSVLAKRRNSRVFINKSLPDILQTMLSEWRGRSPTLARACEFDLSGLNRSRYPVRSYVRQDNETDARFIQRLLRRDGVTWFVKAGPAQSSKQTSSAQDDAPVHTLVFCDDPMRLSQCAAGTVRYHARDAGTEMRDSITYWSWLFELVAGRVEHASWDYKSGQVHQVEQVSAIDQGPSGNDLAQLLSDSTIDVPHAYDSWDDHSRIAHDRMLAHEGQAARIDGISGVRDLAVGFWFGLVNHPVVDAQDPADRQFVTTSLHHRADNNLPKELDDPVTALLDASRPLFDVHAANRTQPATNVSAAQSPGPSDTRYQNTFSCVRRGVPLTPAYDPAIDLPPDHLVTGVIVGPKGEEVFADELGRVRVQIQGLNADDHAHAQGAGTNSTPSDSAPVRVASALAGQGFGMNIPLRIGMECLLATVGGDPDKLVIVGVLSSGVNVPAQFTHTGAMPGNRYVSGLKTKEIKGQRYNQLRFDDTAGEISSQLASEHSYSQLNLGAMTHPRTDGHGEARGDGAELRTDAAAAVRAAKGILLTTYARNQAAGHQLDRDELNRLLAECTELFKALGDYAGQHGGHAGDTQPQSAIAATVKDWDSTTSAGSGTAGAAAGQPGVVAIGAEAGTVNVTPKTHVTYAGENIDQVAQQHVQLTSGQRLNAMAGQGMHLFARGDGVQAVAAEGPLLLQAQADSLTANAQKGVRITSNAGEILATAPTIRLVAEDGSYVQIGNGGITLGTKGDIKLLSASHQWAGPSTQQAPRTSFNNAPTDQQFRLHYPGHTADSPAVASNQNYRMTLDDGRVLEGKSDAGGLTSLVKDDAMRIATIDILKPAL